MRTSIRHDIQSDSGGKAMVMRVMGIIGIVIGLAVIVATLAGVMFHDMQWKGFLYGGLIAVFGVVRFMRGTNQ